MARAFMTDSAQLASLEGQQYLVLRPTGSVGAYYDEQQASLLQQLPKSIQYPNAGHATLRGFEEPTQIEELKLALRAWAAEREPIELRIESVDGFPPPFKVLIAQLARSESLVDAYASLTAMLDATDFNRIGELPLEQWVFHLSLAYCIILSDLEWEKELALSRRDVITRPAEFLAEAEFVWYQDGVELTEVIAFG